MNLCNKNLPLSLIIALAGLLLIGCSDQADIQPVSEDDSEISINNDDQTNNNARIHPFTYVSDWIEFDQLPLNSIASEVYGINGNGPVYVYGVNPKDPDRNAAMVFNSRFPSGDPVNYDLGTPNMRFGGNGRGLGGYPRYPNHQAMRNVLIVSKDFNTSNPNSQDTVGSRIIFDFSALGGVAVHKMYILDIDDDQKAYARFYDASGTLIHEFSLPVTGDNGSSNFLFTTWEGQDHHFDVVDVHRMEVWMNGRAAIDLLNFVPSNTGCTSNVAYWKNHSKYDKERDPAWAGLDFYGEGEDERFFLADATYYEVMNTPAKGGNVYYTLAREFIAADLNYYRGSYANAAVKNAYMKTDPIFRQYSPEQIGALDNHDPLRQELLEYANTFKKYNNGQIGPGRCTN